MAVAGGSITRVGCGDAGSGHHWRGPEAGSVEAATNRECGLPCEAMVRSNPADTTLLAALQAAAHRFAAGHSQNLPPMTVRLSARLTRSAGTYRPPGTITISRHFLAHHGFEAAVEVLRHEVAHHIVQHGRVSTPPLPARRRVRPHGREFQAAAAALGAPRHAPHFSAPRLIHGYRCPACGWTWLRGRPIRRGRRYSCARCAPGYDPRFRLVYAGSWREA